MVRWRLWGGGEGASFFLCLLRIPPLFFSSSFLTTSIKPLPSLPPPPPPYPFYRLPGNPSQRKDPPSLPPSPSLLFILTSCCFSGGKEKGRKEGKALPNKSPLVAAAAVGSPFLFAFWVELSLRPWTLSWGPNCARVCSDAKRPHFASPHAIGRARLTQKEWKKRAPPANHVSLIMAVQRLRGGGHGFQGYQDNSSLKTHLLASWKTNCPRLCLTQNIGREDRGTTVGSKTTFSRSLSA